MSDPVKQGAELQDRRAIADLSVRYGQAVRRFFSRRLRDGAAVEDFSPERILLGREAYARMVEALQELPERARTIFVLNRFEELSAGEIARRLGVSVSTVEKDMMRAIAHLKARLA